MRIELNNVCGIWYLSNSWPNQINSQNFAEKCPTFHKHLNICRWLSLNGLLLFHSNEDRTKTKHEKSPLFSLVSFCLQNANSNNSIYLLSIVWSEIAPKERCAEYKCMFSSFLVRELFFFFLLLNKTTTSKILCSFGSNELELFC